MVGEERRPLMTAIVVMVSSRSLRYAARVRDERPAFASRWSQRSKVGPYVAVMTDFSVPGPPAGPGDRVSFVTKPVSPAAGLFPALLSLVVGGVLFLAIGFAPASTPLPSDDESAERYDCGSVLSTFVSYPSARNAWRIDEGGAPADGCPRVLFPRALWSLLVLLVSSALTFLALVPPLWAAIRVADGREA